jgi:hypothetical protein
VEGSRSLKGLLSPFFPRSFHNTTDGSGTPRDTVQDSKIEEYDNETIAVGTAPRWRTQSGAGEDTHG